MDNGLLLEVSHRFSSNRGKLLENAVFRDLRRGGYEIYRLMDKKEVDFLIRTGTAPHALVNVCSDVSDADTKAREVDGLRLAMRRFDLGCGLVVTLNQSETIPVQGGGSNSCRIEDGLLRLRGGADRKGGENRLHLMRYILRADTAKNEVTTPVTFVYA